MRKAAGKRHKHGVTSAMVFMEVVRLFQLSRRKPVSRFMLLRGLQLEETTIDDRLRVLVRDGSLQKVERGFYRPFEAPVMQPKCIAAVPPAPAPAPAPGYYFLTPESDAGVAEAMRQRNQAKLTRRG